MAKDRGGLEETAFAHLVGIARHDPPPGTPMRIDVGGVRPERVQGPE